jgi:hypothetical protein
MRANSLQLIKFCCTQTDPAAETKSIGLQADPDATVGAGAQIVMVFARYLDNFFVT